MAIILGPDGLLDEFGQPLKGPILDEFGQPFKEMSKDEFIKELENGIAFQKKITEDAEKFLSFYWTKDGPIDLPSMEKWLEKNQKLDRWFFIRLIELAGQKAIDIGVSRHLSIAGAQGGKAKNKPVAELKAWALQQIKSLKMTDIDAAEYLSARIPEHLAGESKNPRQLIYRALLARHSAK